VDVLERLHKLMDARGWTMYRLAKESGLTESTIANIYRRNAIPSIDTLEKICHGFGITLSQFFADAELVELTEDLKEVFENWRTLTPEQKEAALTMMRAFNHDMWNSIAVRWTPTRSPMTRSTTRARMCTAMPAVSTTPCRAWRFSPDRRSC